MVNHCRSRIALVAAAIAAQAGLVAAQGTITFYANSVCNSTHRSIVQTTGPQCQLVPSAPSMTAYMLTCLGDNSGGTVSFFTTGDCSGGQLDVTFANGDCVLSPPAYGSSSWKADCSAAAAAPTAATPANGDFSARWSSTDTCAAGAGATTSVVVARQDLCQTVPSADGTTNHGYVVNCNAAANGGSYTVCRDDQCSDCFNTTRFTNGQCLPNPIEFGSRSVAFTCAMPAPDQNQSPFSEAARLTWFSGDQCEPAAADRATSHRTVVVVRKSVCNLVPDDPSRSYMVKCAGDSESGKIAFCNDPVCGNCTDSELMVNDRCYLNPPAFGARSVSLSCGVASTGIVVPNLDDVLIEWSAQSGCPTAGSAALEKTLLLAPTDVCHTVPGATETDPASGYRVRCNADGNGGWFDVCSRNDCGNCPISTPFSNFDCHPNPDTYGSLSVRFTCMPRRVNQTAGAFGLDSLGGVVAMGGALLASVASAAWAHGV